MDRPGPEGFSGFSPETLAFLGEVRSRNSKPWFEEHRDHYEKVLLTPLKALTVSLSESALAIDPGFEVRPAVGKTISRIFRDTRFSRDKSLFRDRMWITFKRPSREWQDAPAYYFGLNQEGYEFGMGYYAATRSTVDAFRHALDRDPKAFLRVIRFMDESDNPLELRGETYRRRLSSSHPRAIDTWYQRKSFCLSAQRPPDGLLFSSRLTGELSHVFLQSAPLYRFLLALKP